MGVMSPREELDSQLCDGVSCVLVECLWFLLAVQELRVMHTVMLASRVQMKYPVGLSWAGMGQSNACSESCPTDLPQLAFVFTGLRGCTHHPQAPQGQPREFLPCNSGLHNT